MNHKKELADEVEKNEWNTRHTPEGTCPTLDKGLFHKTLGDDFHIDYETRVKIWNFISTRKPSVDEKEPCHFCDNTGCSACDSSLVKP